MKYLKSIFLFLIIYTICSCKDEFLLETNNYKPILVIDGMITNQEGPYKIKISNSSPINQYKESPKENCTVTIFDNTGISEELTEKEPGIYYTNELGIKGEIGKSYRISIVTPEGKEYTSDFQEIKEPTEIEDVSASIVLKETEAFPEGLHGYQFYVSTGKSTNKDNYFLWKGEETYEYTVSFDLYDIFFKIAKLDTNKALRDSVVTKYKNTFYRCWQTRNVDYIFTAKTSNLSIPKITNQPLFFVGTDSKRLQIRYSILLNQYSINKEAYYFWKNVEDQTSEQNFLVANQPYNIEGNVKNINNASDKALGYFTVASVTQKRIFVDAPNEPFHYDICTLIKDPTEILYLFDKEKAPFYLIEWDNSLGIAVLRYEYCVNCTLSGGENTKPDFWIDK